MPFRPSTVEDLFVVGLENSDPAYVMYNGVHRVVTRVLDIRKSDRGTSVYLIDVLWGGEPRGVIIMRPGSAEVLYRMKE